MPKQIFNQKIPNYPTIKNCNINNQLGTLLLSIQAIDFLISDTMLYNNIQQIVDE